MKLALTILVLFLPACAQITDATLERAGVVMSAEEAKTCKEDGCTVWSDTEIKELIQRVHKLGYLAGVKSI